MLFLPTLLTIDATTIRYETKLIQLIHEVLQGIIGDAKQLRLNQALDNPKAIPIVLFTESTA